MVDGNGTHPVLFTGVATISGTIVVVYTHPGVVNSWNDDT